VVAVLFGPPGSGKGTQAAALAARLGVPHVATGDIFRKHLAGNTDLGQLAKSYMSAGKLVPDEVTCKLVASRLGEPDAANGGLFDGFPRSVAQAEWLLPFLSGRGQPLEVAVNLVVPDDQVVTRLGGRRTCTSCGATYHVAHAPPGPGDTCTRCGATVIRRPDDEDAVILQRLQTYHAETAPVLGVLRGAAPVHDVVGTGTIDAVAERIARVIPA
jgi:adenylate kinase